MYCYFIYVFFLDSLGFHISQVGQRVVWFFTNELGYQFNSIAGTSSLVCAQSILVRQDFSLLCVLVGYKLCFMGIVVVGPACGMGG